MLSLRVNGVEEMGQKEIAVIVFLDNSIFIQFLYEIIVSLHATKHLLFYCWPSCSLYPRNSSLWHRTSKVACVQFSSVAQSCLTMCDPMDCSMSGFPVYHQLLELTQTYVHRVSDAIQPSHVLSPPSPAFSLSQNLFQWIFSQGLFQ